MTKKQSPFTPLKPTEKGLRSLARIKERLGVDSLPDALEILAKSEHGINDVYMNLNRHLADGKVEERTKLLVAVGVAAAVGSAPLTDLLAAAAVAKGRTEQEALDAISVATVTGVFNGYYRFRHQLPESARATHEAFRAPFNANTFMKTSLAPLEVEAIGIAVSSVNNCHACVEGHMAKGSDLGITHEQIDELIKVAAITGATANALNALAPKLKKQEEVGETASTVAN